MQSHDHARDSGAGDGATFPSRGLDGIPGGAMGTRHSGEAATKPWQRLRAELRESSWVRALLLEVG